MPSIRQQLRAELGRARRELLAGQVHGFRKSAKRLRALLRLAEEAGVGGSARRARLELRDAARSFARARDREVLTQTARGLGRTAAPCRVLKVRVRAGIRLQDRRTAERAVERLARRVERWPELPVRKPTLARALAWIYRRARKAEQRARQDARPPSLHEWRKRTRDLRHAAEALREGWPGWMAALEDQAHEVEELLGKDHDLVVLEEALSRKALKDLGPRMDSRRRQLRRSIFREADRLFSEGPGAFQAQVARIWKGLPRS